MNRCALIFCLALISACTSTGPVEKFSDRLIDRPYTLPAGLSSWHVVADFSRISDRIDTDPNVTVNPVVWDESLSDNWTLVWSPFPLSARYQIAKSDTSVWGLYFGASFSFGSDTTQLRPQLGFYNRTKIGDDWAWASSLGGQFGWYPSSRYANTGHAFLSTGPLFQITNNFAAGPNLGIAFTKNNYSHMEFDYPNYKVVERPISDWIYPVGVNIDWKISTRWDLGAYYSNLDIGRNRISGNRFGFDLQHLW